MEKQTIIYIMGLIFILISFVFLVISLIIIYYNNKVKNWSSCNGKIIKSYLLKTDDDLYLDIDVHNNSRKVRYTPHIEYEYSINNKKEISNKIYYLNINKMLLNSRISKKLIAKYPENKSISLHLNPENNETFLIKETPLNYKLILFVIFLFLGVYFILFRTQIEYFLT